MLTSELGADLALPARISITQLSIYGVRTVWRMHGANYTYRN
jgi:hypothetical protein